MKCYVVRTRYDFGVGGGREVSWEVSWEVSAGVVSGDRLDHLGSRTRRLDQWQRSARDKSRWV
jgi:hypothetical protein